MTEKDNKTMLMCLYLDDDGFMDVEFYAHNVFLSIKYM